MLDLNFTSKAIDSLERKAGVPIANLIGSSSVGVLFTFIKAGTTGMSDDAVYETIDNYRKDGKSTTALQIEIIEALEEQGFLEKGLGLSQKIKAQIEKVSKMDSLESIGAQLNQQQ